MKEENEVIMLGCIMEKKEVEIKRLKELLENSLDWCYIAGQLLHHRLVGYFYLGIDNLQKYVMAEFFRSTKLICTAQKVIALERYEILKSLFNKFEHNDIRYACLKGLVYGVTIYPYEARRSNDCDILVLESDLNKADKILKEEGFMQSADNGKTEATKEQKLIQRFNYHDLVPYYKNIDSKLMGYIKIDINFHIDGKDNDITNSVLDYGTETNVKDDFLVRSLKQSTHFLQLCLHFYREASNSLWTSQRRDVLLYKVVDIFNTYRTMNENELNESIRLSEEFNVSKALFFTLHYLSQFYPDSDVDLYLERIKKYNLDEINKIFVDGENRFIERKSDFVERAFDLNYCNDFSERKGTICE